jgi:hypothetical protein
MRVFFSELFVCLVFVATGADAVTIYSDNFQQFPNGTVLTQTNYIPNVGVNARIETNEDGRASTTVVASNFLGSTRAFFNLAVPPYNHSYRGDQTGGELTNVAVILSWKLWIETVQPTNAIGGFSPNLLTTNIDSINNGQTNYNSNPLIFFTDGGQVFAFTNNPIDPAKLPNPISQEPFVQIGGWSNLVGTVMTNVLTINYPAGKFSFSLNGTVLTNMPIPQFITNIFDRVRLGIYEGSTNASFASVGNRFALDDVRLDFVSTDFQITGVVIFGKTNSIIRFKTESGALYEVQKNNELVAPAWQTITNNVSGTGGIVAITNTFGANRQRQFYRVRLQ